MDWNFSSCSRGTERFSIFNSAENKLRARHAGRWPSAADDTGVSSRPLASPLSLA